MTNPTTVAQNRTTMVRRISNVRNFTCDAQS